MPAYIVLVALLALPVAMGIFFRVSAPNLFFSIMAGELLARYFGGEAGNITSSFVTNPTVASYTHFALLVIPMLLTCLFLRNSVSRTKTVLNIIPLVVTGVVFAAFAIPLLPISLQETIKSTNVGNQFVTMDSFVIGAVVAFQLLALWVMNLTGTGREHKKK